MLSKFLLLAGLFGSVAVISSIRPFPVAAENSPPPPAEAVPATPATAPEAAPATPRTGLVTIESDRQQADNRTGVITATGNVRITYPDRGMVATSRQAQYFSREGRLILSGDVDVVDAEGQSIQAERLVYRLDSERLLAEPPEGEQVKSRLRVEPAAGGQGDSLLP